jgi:hypothetical protein
VILKLVLRIQDDVDRINVAENRGGCEHGIASSFPAVWGI